jgi:hypothetical protein
MQKTITALAFSALAFPALALDKMPEEPGFSGFVNLGVGTGSIESNFLARLSGLDIDLGDDTINDFGSPDDEDITAPAINLNVNYTFSNLKTQVSLGNDLADFLQFDRSTRLALRHDFDSIGRFQLALLSSAFPQTEVWKDPYLIDEKRKETERSSTGGRITWDKIFGSHFELKLGSRKIELDDERSGEGLGLSREQRKLLDREGDIMRAELGYLFNLGNGRHFVRPSVAYIDRDLDGDAMAQDGYEVALSWLYNSPSKRLTWANNIAYSSLEGDKKNPIFDEVNDADQVVVASQMFFPGLFGMEKWEPNMSVIWGDSDSDIDFNDGAGWMFNVGIGRKF